MPFRFIHEVSSPEAVEVAVDSGASTLLIPQDAPASELRSLARARDSRVRIFVAVARAGSDRLEAELEAFGQDLPDGVVLADCRGRRDLQQLSVKLAVRETLANRPDGAVRILAMAGQSAAGALTLPDLADGSHRLEGLVHDPGALARAIGVDPASATLRTAMSQSVFAAAAAEVPAFLALSPLQDPATLVHRCARISRAGFAGAILRTPAHFAAVRQSPGMIDKRP